MVERSLSMREVPGSMPGASILNFIFLKPDICQKMVLFFFNELKGNRGRSSDGRALA
jgi:hypothetical protein